MEFPLHIGFGPLKISAHLLFETLAFVIGFRYFLHLRKKKPGPISESNRVWILIGAAFGAFFFSRLIGALEGPVQWALANNPGLYFFANKTIVGGLAGGLLAVEVTKYFIGEKSSSGDLFTFPLVLAMIIGRLGCFTQGVYEQTYGIETTVPWALDLGDGLLRHPVALYEIAFLLVLWWLLQNVSNKYPLKNGMLFQFFMIGYFAFRFLLDFIKPGFRYDFINLSTIQLACLLVLFYYSKTIFYIFTKKEKLKRAH